MLQKKANRYIFVISLACLYKINHITTKITAAITIRSAVICKAENPHALRQHTKIPIVPQSIPAAIIAIADISSIVISSLYASSIAFPMS